jgi:hypothetical protein
MCPSATAFTPPPRPRLALLLTLLALLQQRGAAYPEMAGSCGRPTGTHLPNEAQTGDGGFAVGLEILGPSSTAERRATVTLSHRSGTRGLKGFLLRAVDAETLAELGSFAQLPPSTMLYEGCTRPAAAVCQQGKGKHDHDRRCLDDEEKDRHGHDDDAPVALPATLEVQWPADRELRLMFWAVDDKHRYYLAQTSSSPAAAAAGDASELDLRLASCPREALPLPVVATSLAGFVLVVALGAIPAVRLHPGLLKVIMTHRRLQDLLPVGVWDCLPTMLQVALEHYGGFGGWTAGQVGVVALWLVAQGAAAAIAASEVRGFPLDVTAIRVLGKLAACGQCAPVTRLTSISESDQLSPSAICMAAEAHH